MKSVESFLDQCLAVSGALPALDVPLDSAIGSIVAADIAAVSDLPECDLADGDGYAVVAESIAQASASHPVHLPVMGQIGVTAVSGGVLVPGSCAFVASGAPLPEGADAVVPVDATDRASARVAIMRSVPRGANIRFKAADLKKSVDFLHAGVRLDARHIALLAAQGYASVPVHPVPRVVVLAVGDELQEPGREPHAGNHRARRVYDASSYALANAIRDMGIQVFRVGVVGDDKRILRETIEDQLVRADILITTGGLSYGGGDCVKEVLTALGDVRFDAVAMWPCRQVGVGKIGSEATVFCLPGNPVSALTAFEVFIRPALRTMAGYKNVERYPLSARLSEPWDADPRVQEYVPARVLGNPQEGYTASLLIKHRQPVLSALAQANGLAIIPAGGSERFESGTAVSCIIFDA